MEGYQIALIILGVVIFIFLIIYFKIPKKKKENPKEFLIFKNKKGIDGDDKTSFFAQHRETGRKTKKFESLSQLQNHINKFRPSIQI